MSRGGRTAGAFVSLQRIARSFDERGALSPRRDRELTREAASLGSVAIPLCLRELTSPDPGRRRWAAALLIAIARGARDRVVAEVRALVATACADAVKVSAMGLLADLDEPAPAPRFADPAAVHKRSLGELADLLTTPPDVALAADLLVDQLDGDDLVDFVDGLIQSSPTRTRHLIDELLIRTELDAGLRAELRRIASPLALITDRIEPLRPSPLGAARVQLLRDAVGRSVVLVSRRGATGWRCLGILIRPDGAIGDAMHRDDTSPDTIADEIVSPLCADGYAPVAIAFAAARTAVAAAARQTVAAGSLLPGAYYLGRDLFELGDAHLPDARTPDPHVALLGRATDLLGRGDHERARPLFERLVAERPDDADGRSGLGLCLFAAGDLDGAGAQLEHATRLEPAWPLHLWNLASLRHRQGRAAACYLTLRRFVAGADRAPAAARDAAHDHRVALAIALVADYERRVHLDQPGCDALRFAEVAEGLRRAPKNPVSGRRRRSTLRRSPARP